MRPYWSPYCLGLHRFRGYYARCWLPLHGQSELLHPQSRFRDMQWLSRGKFDRLPRTTAGFTFGALDGCGLCCHLPAHPNTACLLSSSCSSARVFAPRFLQTSPRDSALALRYHFTSITLWRGLTPPSYRSCSAHKTRGATGESRLCISLDSQLP